MTADYLRRTQCGDLFLDAMPVVCCMNATVTPTRLSNSEPTTVMPEVNYGECGKSERQETRIVGGKNATIG